MARTVCRYRRASDSILTQPGLVDGASRAAGAPGTVLIVDDEPDIVSLLMAALRPEGFRLLSAGDGRRPWPWPGRPADPHSPGLDDARAHGLGGLPRLTRRGRPAAASGAGGAPDLARGGGEHRGRVCGWRHRLPGRPFKLSYVRSRVRSWLLRSQGAACAGTAPADLRGCEEGRRWQANTRSNPARAVPH